MPEVWRPKHLGTDTLEAIQSERMSKVYLDTETCGLHSMMVLLQYAEEDGPIRLHEVWRRPIRETLR